MRKTYKASVIQVPFVVHMVQIDLADHIVQILAVSYCPSDSPGLNVSGAV